LAAPAALAALAAEALVRAIRVEHACLVKETLAAAVRKALQLVAAAGAELRLAEVLHLSIMAEMVAQDWRLA
jgi:hypothetical protein